MTPDVSYTQRQRYLCPDLGVRQRFDLRTDGVTALVLGTATGLYRASLLMGQCPGQICIPAMTNAGLGVDLICSLLTSLRVPLHRFELSLAVHRLLECETETLLGLSKARDAGLGLALAGVRLQHLPLLARLPLSAIILDPWLIGCLQAGPTIDIEVASLAIAAQTLGIEVVAPAIESAAQRDRLIALGVACGEGELLEDASRAGVTCLPPQRATASFYDDRSNRDEHPGADRGPRLREVHLPQ